jgi:DNA-binding CsgD family transcriptional regulator
MSRISLAVHESFNRCCAVTKDKITPSSPQIYEPSEARGSPNPGFLVFDCSLRLLYANSEALAILQYPECPSSVESLPQYVLQKLLQGSSFDVPGQMPSPAFRAELVSGNRRYKVRIVSFESGPWGREASLAIAGHEASLALLLERGQRQDHALRRLSMEFRLSPRETEVLRLLTEGLTNKEIASTLGVSTNTVKVFVRGVMLKVGVSGRSAMVARIMRERK